MITISGKIWVFGDQVDTDQILPGYAMAESAENLAQYAMAGSTRPDFAKLVQPGDVIVAGENFGCGSSREQAPVALKNAGISLIVAVSFARIFRRNAINIGLPVLLADLTRIANDGDMISVNLDMATIAINDRVVQGQMMSETSLTTIMAGGLINRVRQEIAERNGVEC